MMNDAAATADTMLPAPPRIPDLALELAPSDLEPVDPGECPTLRCPPPLPLDVVAANIWRGLR